MGLDRSSHVFLIGGRDVRGKQIAITVAVALAVVLGVKTYEAKAGK